MDIERARELIALVDVAPGGRWKQTPRERFEQNLQSEDRGYKTPCTVGQVS